jgi:hypothetical protein
VVQRTLISRCTSDWLDKRLARLDAELEYLIFNNPVSKDLSELLCSAPGIAPVVSATVGDSDWRVDCFSQRDA